MSAETATAWSDLALAILTAALAMSLPGRSGSRQMAGFLASSAAAAALGGAWHAWHTALAGSQEFWLWKLTLAAVGTSNAFLLLSLGGAIESRTAWRAVVFGKLALVGLAIAATTSFRPAIGDQILTEVMVIALVAWDRRRKRRLPGAPLAAGVAFAFGGGIIQVAGLDLGAALNHNVLYHVCGAASLLSFWRAGRKL